MNRQKLMIAAAAGAFIVALSVASAGWAAQSSKALDGVAGGLWELNGMPGTKSPVRQCIADPVDLAFIEHQAAGCSHLVLGDSGDELRVSFKCSGEGFGQSSIKQVTPRSLRVDVQGIADGGPYAYVLQAHRVGECGGAAESSKRR
ncbi:MAG: hypothetical protein ABIR63_06140 [Sphingomicrobium sp.]